MKLVYTGFQSGARAQYLSELLACLTTQPFPLPRDQCWGFAIGFDGTVGLTGSKTRKAKPTHEDQFEEAGSRQKERATSEIIQSRSIGDVCGRAKSPAAVCAESLLKKQRSWVKLHIHLLDN